MMAVWWVKYKNSRVRGTYRHVGEDGQQRDKREQRQRDETSQRARLYSSTSPVSTCMHILVAYLT